MKTTKPVGAAQAQGVPELHAPRDPSVSRAAVLPSAPSAYGALTLPPQRAGLSQALRQLLYRYAAEVRRFLRSRTSSRYSMEEVYSAFSEDVWKGLPQLRTDGPSRAWIYVVARHALSRHVRLKRRWRDRHTFSGVENAQLEPQPSLELHEAQQGQLAPLLSELADADRQLLARRLTDGLSWRAIALESARAAGDTSDAFVTRESARLRKRYQLLIEALRKRAREGD